MATAAPKSLGIIPPSNDTSFGEILVNNTGQTLNSFSLSYTGEDWWQYSGAAQTMSFSYLVGGTTLSGGTTVAGLSFTTPNPGIAGTVDGSTASYQTAVNGAAYGLDWDPAEALTISWNKGTTGGGDGLGIANLSFSATYLNVPGITNASTDTVYAGETGQPSFSVTASNSPTSFTATGSIPSWVTFNTSTGLMTFVTPTAVTTTTNYMITFTATNGSGTGAAQTFTLTELPTVGYGTAGVRRHADFQRIGGSLLRPDIQHDFGCVDLTAAFPNGFGSSHGLGGWYEQNLGTSTNKMAVGLATTTTGALYDFYDAPTTLCLARFLRPPRSPRASARCW